MHGSEYHTIVVLKYSDVTWLCISLCSMLSNIWTNFLSIKTSTINFMCIIIANIRFLKRAQVTRLVLLLCRGLLQLSCSYQYNCYIIQFLLLALELAIQCVKWKRVQCMYISTISIGMSSSNKDWSKQILNSILSVVDWGSCLQNHGGLLKSQQVLLPPHPWPSQSGSSE